MCHPRCFLLLNSIFHFTTLYSVSLHLKKHRVGQGDSKAVARCLTASSLPRAFLRSAEKHRGGQPWDSPYLQPCLFSLTTCKPSAGSGQDVCTSLQQCHFFHHLDLLFSKEQRAKGYIC